MASPTVGTSFGTHASADFNGTTQYLDMSGGTKLSALLSAASYFVQLVVQPDTAAATSANPYQEVALFTDTTGKFYVTYSTSGVRAGHYDGTSYKATSYVACATGAKHCIQVWYDGSKIWLRVDGGTPVSVTAGNLDAAALAGTPRMGANYDLTKFFDGKIAQLLTAQTPPNNIHRISLRGDAQNRYGTVAHAAATPNPAGNYDDPANWTTGAAFWLGGGEDPTE